MDEFNKWLNTRLKELQVDENVFGSYIESIVTSDDDLELKRTSISDLLMDLLEVKVFPKDNFEKK